MENTIEKRDLFWHQDSYPDRTERIYYGIFSQLTEQTNAERILAKSFRGLCTRLQNKILGHNLCMAFNSIFREPCDIGKIKELIKKNELSNTDRFFGLLRFRY